MIETANTPLLSVCVPTNGVSEWVFPMLDSIFRQGVEETLFEVVITDNGKDQEFEKKMHQYASQHRNIVYQKTKVLPFMNEIEAYCLASGTFIKYLNHRSLMKDGTLQEYIRFVRANLERKPGIYFSNGVLTGGECCNVYKSFDEFVGRLSYYSSWSTGMAFWREDFEKIDVEHNIDVLFPHTRVLFSERQKSEYIVDNRTLLDEQKVGNVPKATYDLFYAFAVDYPMIVLQLVQEGDVSLKTFLKFKKELLDYLIKLHYSYILRKRKCSYILSGFKDCMSVFYGKRQVLLRYPAVMCKLINAKLKAIRR